MTKIKQNIVKKMVANPKTEVGERVPTAPKTARKGYRYVAPPAPETAFKKRSPSEQKEHENYYKTHKGSYVKNVLGKDGKYI